MNKTPGRLKNNFRALFNSTPTLTPSTSGACEITCLQI